MIQIINKRTSTHPNHCEDNYYLYEGELYEGEDVIIGAVLDGCSTGLNSHFASQFIKYSMDKNLNYINLQNNLFDVDILFNPNPVRGFNLLSELILEDICKVKDLLKLDALNFLSTIVYFAFDVKTCKLTVQFCGDGTMIVTDVNGQTFRYSNDEGNTPQYLAYQMPDSNELYEYLDSRIVKVCENVESFAICTDGIDSFVNLKNPHLNREVAVNYLIFGEDFKYQKTGLSKRFNVLTNTFEDLKKSEQLFWWDIKDDLTVIKYTPNEII